MNRRHFKPIPKWQHVAELQRRHNDLIIIKMSSLEIQLAALLLFHYCMQCSMAIELLPSLLLINSFMLKVFMLTTTIILPPPLKKARDTHTDSHRTRFRFNCDKNLQWIQTVGCYFQCSYPCPTTPHRTSDTAIVSVSIALVSPRRFSAAKSLLFSCWEW